ncbi:MAG: D-hexose-6-phosphate mutarotase [Verrucomicrobiota bacterium]
MPLTPDQLAALPASVQLDDSLADYPLFRIKNAQATAALALHGAHLIDFVPHGEQPVLYTSPSAIFQEGQAIRGGVPLCSPWFGTHPEDSSKPFHGFVRNRFWRFDGAYDLPTGSTQLLFSLHANEVLRKIWPYDFTIVFKVVIGTELEMALTYVNLERESVRMGGALHSYFAVSGIDQVSVVGLEQKEFIDAAEGFVRKPAEGRSLDFDQWINRVYLAAPRRTRLVDRGWDRTIKIESEGSATTVVWNAWKQQAADFKDMPDDGYLHYACIETANADEDMRVLHGGESHELLAKISLECAG